METAISWLENETFINLKTADEAGRSIQYLLEQYNTSEQLEKVLAIVGRLMDAESPKEAGPDAGTSALIKSQMFCLNLAKVLDKYAEFHGVFADFSKPSGDMNHAVYELTLFILLGIAEKSPFLKSFVEMLSKDQLSTMVYSVCSILQVDTFYYTQEMALELIARLCHLLLAENKGLENFTSISPVIKVHLTNRKSIFDLLKDMRPVLNRLNESNKNILTYPLASIQVQNLEVTQASWLDLCATHFCFHSEIVNAYLKFPLEAVISSRFVGGKNQHVEVALSAAPEPWQEFLAAQDLVLNSPLKLFFMDPEDAKTAVSFLSGERKVGVTTPAPSPTKSSTKKAESSVKPERKEPQKEQPKQDEKQEEIPRVPSDDISSLTVPDMDPKGVEEGRKISKTRASKAESTLQNRDSLLVMGEAHQPLRPKTPPEPVTISKRPIEDNEDAGTEGDNESVVSEEKKAKPKRGRPPKAQSVTPKARKQPAAKATSAKKTPAKKTIAAATPASASKTRAQKTSVDKELITPVEEAAEPMSTRKRPRSQDSETPSRAKMRAVSTDTGKRGEIPGTFNQSFGGEGWGEDAGDTGFDYDLSFDNEPLPAEPEVVRKPVEEAAKGSPRAARLRSSTATTPAAAAVSRDRDWGKEDIVNAAPPAASGGPSVTRGNHSRMRSPSAVQSERAAASEPSRRVPLQPLSANVDKSHRPQSASSQPSSAGGSASRGGPMRKYGKQPLSSIAEDEEQSRAREQSKAKAEEQRKQEQARQLQEEKRREEEQKAEKQRERERQERQRREEKERKEREEAERKERLRFEERERRQRKEEEERQERYMSISQELELGAGSEPNGAASSRTRSSKRTRDESFADVEEEELEELPWDRDAGTSAADESTALSKLLVELKTLPEKRKKAKRRKRLKNIEISANDQLKAYMNQVILFLSFHLKEIDNTFRNGYDNMSFSVQNTISTNNVMNEMNALQQTLDEFEKQSEETRRATVSFHKQVNDLRNQEQEAVSSYHRSINQARHSARNRAIDKIRSSQAAAKASSNDIFEQLRHQGIRL